MIVKEYFNQIENDISKVFIEMGRLLEENKRAGEVYSNNINQNMKILEEKYFFILDEDYIRIKNVDNEELSEYELKEYENILNIYKGLRKIFIDIGYIERKKSLSELKNKKPLMEQLEEIKNKCKKQFENTAV